MIPGTINQAPIIPSLFGQGLLGNAVTGLVRIPGFLASIAAVQIAAELAIRALSGTLSAVGFNFRDDSWVNRLSAKIIESGIRPYTLQEDDYNDDVYYNTAPELVVKMVALAALGIAVNELVRILGGNAPSIYNHGLSFIGPIRIFSGSYLEGVYTTLRALGLRS